MPFCAWHLQFLDVQPEQWAVAPRLTPEYGEALAAAGCAFTAFVGIEVIACAGIVSFWPGRSQVWAIMSSLVPQYRYAIHRAVKAYVRGYRCARLECVIDPTFSRSVRWAHSLGFTLESPMPKYGVNGEDMAMYVRLEQ